MDVPDDPIVRADLLDLIRVQRESGLVLAVTYNYTGYPLVRQAREMILSGELDHVPEWAFYMAGGIDEKGTGPWKALVG